MVGREVYTHGYEEWARQWMSERTVADAAGFLVPYLRSGMRMLDCGCGPGSITLGLAAIAAPGEVVGIDIEPRQIESARLLAEQRGVANVSFQQASMYELPFPDASFDAVLAHTVVEHLGDPPAAFREVRRVLRPGGVFGVRDPDYSTMRFTPATPGLEEPNQLIGPIQAMSGGSPYYAPTQRSLLLQAGFSRAEAGAEAISLGTPEQTSTLPFIVGGMIREPAFVDAAARCGIDQSRLEAFLEEVRAWAAAADGFWALVLCHAVGWA